jgi:hypothetical protein
MVPRFREVIKGLLKNCVHFKRTEYSLANYGLNILQHEMKCEYKKPWVHIIEEDYSISGRICTLKRFLSVLNKTEFSIMYSKLSNLHAL